MTVQELIDRLQSLPPSSREAQAVIEHADFDDDLETVAINDVKYEYGEVIIVSDD